MMLFDVHRRLRCILKKSILSASIVVLTLCMLCCQKNGLQRFTSSILGVLDPQTSTKELEQGADQEPSFVRRRQLRQSAMSSSLLFGGDEAVAPASSYKDPKSVQLKSKQPPPQFEIYHLPPPTIQNRHEQEFQEDRDGAEVRRYEGAHDKFDILVIGGTVTMGGRLESIRESYPYLLGGSHVHVISHPYESVEYLSLCLDTILSEEHDQRKHQQKQQSSSTADPNHRAWNPNYHHTHYDVILLEFSMTESYVTLAIESHLPLLLHRLRQRYPDALIVYVHLWPMVAMVEEESTGIKPGNLVPSEEDLTLLKWQWIQDSPIYRFPPKLESIIQDLHSGYIYYLPFHSSTPQESDWFLTDWWHLSKIGHEGVAQGIKDLLISQQVKLEKQRSSTEDYQQPYKGDQCISWFTNGIIPLQYAGGELANVYEANPILPKNKYVLDAIDTTTTLTVHNPFTSSVPIYLSYLTATEPVEISIVHVYIKHSSASSQLHYNDRQDSNSIKKLLIDPNVDIAQFLPSIQLIDLAYPGDNTIYVETLESRQNPFRIIGIFLSCGSNSYSCSTASTATATLDQPTSIRQKNQEQPQANLTFDTSSTNKATETTKFPFSTLNTSSKRASTDFSSSTITTATATANSNSPIRILALGGSNTWGAFIPDRYRAYPWLIEEAFNGALSSKEYVDNIAMRATGADYPSLCLESMIPESATKSYDVILFDFVLNGTNGFFLLLKRLRERFPDAVLIYVHIWNILSIARYDGKPPSNGDVGLNPNLEWEWGNRGDTFNPNGIPNKNCPREICDGAVMEQLTIDAGGYIYKLPLPPTPKVALANGWFGPDWQHLSAKGHEVLANGIVDILRSHETDVRSGSKRLGTFGLGDQCFQWFANGIVQPMFTGAMLVNLIARDTQRDPNVAKWVMEMDSDGGTITFESKFPIRVPIGLSYMSKQQDSSYTIVEISVNSNDNSQEAASTRHTTITIDPNYNLSGPTTHITVYSHIGWANPGFNTITIRTVEMRQLPFRVVGIFLCGHCAERGGDMGNGAIRSVDDGSKEEQ